MKEYMPTSAQLFLVQKYQEESTKKLYQKTLPVGET